MQFLTMYFAGCDNAQRCTGALSHSYKLLQITARLPMPYLMAFVVHS